MDIKINKKIFLLWFIISSFCFIIPFLSYLVIIISIFIIYVLKNNYKKQIKKEKIEGEKEKKEIEDFIKICNICEKIKSKREKDFLFIKNNESAYILEYCIANTGQFLKFYYISFYDFNNLFPNKEETLSLFKKFKIDIIYQRNCNFYLSYLFRFLSGNEVKANEICFDNFWSHYSIRFDHIEKFSSVII